MTVLTQEVKNRPDLKVIEGGALVDATDFQLIRACQAGETKAFNKLMLRHKNIYNRNSTRWRRIGVNNMKT